jgi:hypothetical protein
MSKLFAVKVFFLVGVFAFTLLTQNGSLENPENTSSTFMLVTP